jgi:CRP/FNR family cyclic AMP-dependent transcriptional regulator
VSHDVEPKEARARVLAEDSELAGALEPAEAAIAEERSVVTVLEVDRGAWEPPVPSPELRDGFGLLVLDGLLTRDVVLAGLGCTELLAKGDVLRPWEDDEGEPSVPLGVEWAAVEPSRIAVLDRGFAAAVAPWPSIATMLVARLVRRSHSLAMHLAISRLVGIDLRLYVLFWHLADRFGRAGPEGVVVPLRLTHATLAKIVSARRPSVTSALRELRARGLVETAEDGTWILHGDPRHEIEAMLKR